MSQDANLNTKYVIDYSATEIMPVSIAALVLLIPVIVMQIKNHEQPRNRNAKHTTWLMVCVMASNTLHQMIFYWKWFICKYCGTSNVAYYCTRAVLKGFNLLFLIHRANLAQGMSPVLSKKWFEKILPSITGLLVIGFVFSIIEKDSRTQYICIQYDDWNALDHCHIPGEPQTNPIAVFAIGVDVSITLGLMILLIVPLYRVYNVDLGVMNANQLRHREKLKTLLVWSVVMTFVNQLTSTLILLRLLHPSEFTKALWIIGLFDPPINIWTSWLMVTRNRRYLREICHCFAGSKTRARRALFTVELTDVFSRSQGVSSAEQVSCKAHSPTRLTTVPSDIN